MDLLKFKDVFSEIGQKYFKDNEEPYNVLKVVRKREDEINLHSRFLHDLLSTDGEHKQGNLFVDRFIEKLKFDKRTSNRVYAYREKNNIDIYINYNGNKYIIIENKINAKDQDNQLNGYYEKIKEKYPDADSQLVYLTKDGEKPSYEINSEYKCKFISYKKDILPWLKNTIKEDGSKFSNELNVGLKAYIKIIKEVLEMSEKQKGNNEIFEKLRTMDAKDIEWINGFVNNWANIKVKLLETIFEELKKRIEITFKELLNKNSSSVEYSFDVENARKYYANYDKSEWINLHFYILKCKKYNIILVIELDDRLCYGIQGADNNWEVVGDCEDPKYDKIEEFIRGKISTGGDQNSGRNPYWIFYKYFDFNEIREINFHDDGNGKFTTLINDEKREKIITKIIKDVKELVDLILEQSAKGAI
ncbi:MAG: hypothetical protein B0D92_04500 [Spirochaeta sp. LUC14_002_19_P3]|nr:MAG: hypothetical protein B0D92_04500 [Spirochaeta sp. LUC14_002_19_P3]